MTESKQPTVESLMALVDQHGAMRWRTGCDEQARRNALATKTDAQAQALREGIRAYAEALAAHPSKSGDVVAWRVRGYNQFKTSEPGPWRYFDGAEQPRVNVPADCDFEPLYATPSTPPTAPDGETYQQLMKFYAVDTFGGLVDAQARHIEKLQAKLPPTPSLAPQRVREG